MTQEILVATDKTQWKFYQDAHEFWRWTQLSADGKIVDSSPEGYPERRDCDACAQKHGFVQK
ncbi:hypothetical protein [Kiloniella sp. b19]|uniref:hypothetical protein n=1 Tax=Kiloniella sp. GXU_MW_B19 TaxID=3141326 RepID=UPI0031DD5FB7